MKTVDMETVLAAVELARHILGEYIEPGPRDAAVTLERLMMTLDDEDLVKRSTTSGAVRR